MPKYKYIVVNSENRQLNGTISAQDENAARQELNDLGFSVVSMAQTEENATADKSGTVELPFFEFAGIDKNQKRVVGTIEAEDRYNAYKRLVSEYTFEIEYVIDNKLSENEKIKERKKGAYELQEQLNQETTINVKKQTTDEKELEESNRKQEILKSQIEFVLNKVKEILDLYEQKLKPETKEKIRQYVDKILRIKTSTNIDYVKKTAEELLEFLQKEEIFINEETQVEERNKMVMEAKNMMIQLRKGKAKDDPGLRTKIIQWHEKNLIQNPNPGLHLKILYFLISNFVGLKDENPEIKKIKQDISSVNDQLIHYLKLYFQAPNPQFKTESKAILKQLWNNRKNLKQNLKDLRKKLSIENKLSSGVTKQGVLLDELNSFSGWLLFFYLVYYFISIYLTTKNLTGIFGKTEIPAIFFIYKSTFIKYFLATLFLFHASLSIKKNFFRQNQIANIIITPLFLLSSLIIYLNF